MRKLLALLLMMVCCSAVFAESAGKEPQISGEMAKNHGCGGQLFNGNDLFHYSFSNGVLSIEHYGATFNACITGLETAGYVRGNIVTIHSSESYGSGGPCDCLGSVDLKYTVSNLSVGAYEIVIDNRAAEGNRGAFRFKVDLIEGTSGQYPPQKSEASKKPVAVQENPSEKDNVQLGTN